MITIWDKMSGLLANWTKKKQSTNVNIAGKNKYDSYFDGWWKTHLKFDLHMNIS
jgi:hypothetical protein